jgi:hypothetical protein
MTESAKRKKMGLSPLDTTPILVNGNPLSREDLTPIVETVQEEEEQAPEINLLENPDLAEELFEPKSPTIPSPSKVLNTIPKTYKRFDPPFPNQQKYTSYIQNVESTDATADSNGPRQKVSSPSSDISIEPRPVKTEPVKQTILSIQSPPASPRQRVEIISTPRTSANGQATNGQANGPSANGQANGPSANISVSQPQSPTRIPSPNRVSEETLISKAHDYYLKYQVLQKSWPEYKFPSLDERLVHTKPQLVIDSYTKSIERIQIDMDVSQYKIALIIMFLVIEVVCVKFLGFDAGGYTLSQIKAMNRYEKLLIEIGERKLLIGGDSWPPEVKILFIGLFNCGLFILMKYLSSILGSELVGYISPIVNSLFTGVLDNSKTSTLPDDVPQRQQDMSGMLGNVASMAANAFTGGNNQNNTSGRSNVKASRRPVYRE